VILAGPTRPNYGFVADTIAGLPTLLATDRENRGVTVEQQADLIGISRPSLEGLGPRSHTSTTEACLRYLGGLA
jgi:hypothetical protein